MQQNGNLRGLQAAAGQASTALLTESEFWGASKAANCPSTSAQHRDTCMFFPLHQEECLSTEKLF